MVLPTLEARPGSLATVDPDKATREDLSRVVDPYWQAVVDFLVAQGFEDGSVVGPVEMAEFYPVENSYTSFTASDLKSRCALIVHKGRYKEISPDLMGRALDRLHPGFANEVFIVLTSDGPVEDPRSPHLGDLEALKRWASSQAPVAASASARMGATYLGRDEVLVETAFGHLMTLIASDRSITPHMIRHGYYDPGITSLLRRLLKPGMDYIDVGANVGVYAVLAAGCVGSTGSVVAIEANPRIALLLEDNLALNGFDTRSQTLKVAASHQDGQMIMYEFARHAGSHTLVEAVAAYGIEKHAEEVREITVPARQLTALFSENNIRSADIMKIDIEGFELPALQGAEDFIIKTRPAIIMEWSPKMMTVETSEELFGLLSENWGYIIERIAGDGQSVTTSYAELMNISHSDILCTPTDRR